MTNKLCLRPQCRTHDVRSLVWTRMNHKTGKWETSGSHDTVYCRDCSVFLSAKTGKPVSKKGKYPPDLDGGNDQRAERARAAITAYRLGKTIGRDDTATSLGDLFADIRHYWDRYGTKDINDVWEDGARNYEAETSDNLADVLGAVEVVDSAGRIIATAPGWKTSEVADS